MAEQSTLLDKPLPHQGGDIVDPEPQLPARRVESLPATTAVPSVESMLMLAIEKGIDADSLAKLVDLQERVMAKRAEMAFNGAFQEFQASCPPIEKNKIADTGKFKYRYADLDNIAETVKPALKANGFSYTFDAQHRDGKLAVTCNLHHVEGHSRSASVELPAYNFDKINSLQCEGVRNSYGKRYSLLAVLGLTTADPDTDGDLPPSGERPDRNDSAPAGTPRDDRVSRDECIAFRTAWLNLGLNQADFATWVSEACGIAVDAVPVAQNWTRSHMDRCKQRLSDAISASEGGRE